jgi:hypothetical protein
MPTDTERLDWLARQRVQVLIPLRWGHAPGFTSEPDLEEESSDLRGCIDAMMKTQSPKGGGEP